LELKNNHTRQAPCLSILGTGSDVGKSIIVTAFCRYFVKQGFKVAPFKAQNMSNNSGVTPEGLEMGRAQIVQAEAAKIPPLVDMNPILLKPTSEIGSQVVLLGRVSENMSAKDYHDRKDQLFGSAAEALNRLRRQFDLIVMEGAGSCAEVNLMDNDIVNLRMAEIADAPVILVADIHRGGVFAQIVGTLECLKPSQRDLIKGFIINRFRGDIQLFEDGVRWIEEKTGKKVFGVLPWYNHINIEPEDSVVIEKPKRIFPVASDTPSIAVIRLPHISNFNDFNPLETLKGLDIYFLEQIQTLSNFRAVILPGTKNTCFDLKWLHTGGWSQLIKTYAQAGGHVLGICGGYQMMGSRVRDPNGLEGSPGSTAGLDLLPVETQLKAPKTTTLTEFSWQGIQGAGYEIHMGQTDVKKGNSLFEVIARNGKPAGDRDGCVTSNLRLMGTYIHGIFDNPKIVKQWLSHIGITDIEISELESRDTKDKEYDLLAEHFETYVDLAGIMETINLNLKDA
jgi:adenosylcobyric acid synthase